MKKQYIKKNFFISEFYDNFEMERIHYQTNYNERTKLLIFRNSKFLELKLRRKSFNKKPFGIDKIRQDRFKLKLIRKDKKLKDIIKF